MILSLTSRSFAENRMTVSYDNMEYLIGEAHGKDIESLIKDNSINHDIAVELAIANKKKANENK